MNTKSRDNARFLPIGVQDFEKMIQGDFTYVDKTRYIHAMVRPLQGFYFLARPRRFGKSLLVSTLSYLFQGKKALFDGLWIGETDWDWEPHPVLALDFNTIDTARDLEASLCRYLGRIARTWEIGLSTERLKERFAELILGLSQKTGKTVVVLADEYDKPIIDHLGKGDVGIGLAKQNRDILKGFFGVLKAQEISGRLRLVFITGISKFARVSIFSDLNNLDDLSLDERYDAVLGYTQEELNANFSTQLDGLAEKLEMGKESLLAEIRRWYNGYRFTDSPTQVYNPFSVLSLLGKGRFKNYWFETATPSFLVNLIQQYNYPVAEIESLELSEEYFAVYELDRLALEPLLFQTGCITIKDYDGYLYKLGYPNQEVKSSFTNYVSDHLQIRNES